MRLHHHDFSNGKSWETSSGGMSSCKCNIISACVAFIAQNVAAAWSTRGFSPVEFVQWWKQKACWLNQHKTTDCDCFAVAFARGQEALQWQSERHESVLVPRDIHLSQVWLPLLYYFSLLIHLIFRHCRTLPSDSTENYKASWTPQKSLIPPAMMAKMGHREESSGFCFVGSISICCYCCFVANSYCNKSER